ncbi:hypothetical protein AwErysi_00290 [Erysipelotrichaceae bacterium]|nr:hypothetical protein AwErysi_00290 [Erysipelotrichaceae bacterium]
MLTIQNLQVSFGTQLALNISEEIIFEKGDRIGIIGSNGSGKTTLLKSILNLIPYSGTITSSIPIKDIALHLQENNYTNYVDTKVIIETVLCTKIANDVPLQELITYFDFDACLRKKFKQLSGGQKQRMTLILVLMQNSEITFFDEVTSGLDFETRQQLMEKLTEWYVKNDKTIAIVSHYYEELEQLANKILILDKGVVLAFGKTTDLFTRYCGFSVITILSKDTLPHMPSTFRMLASPSHLKAFSCSNSAEERAITDYFITHNINFNRSNCDLEIMFINIKDQEGCNHA